MLTCFTLVTRYHLSTPGFVFLPHMSYCLYSVYSLESNCKIVTEERGLQDICAAMQCHESCVDLIETACSALWSLSMEGKNYEHDGKQWVSRDVYYCTCL